MLLPDSSTPSRSSSAWRVEATRARITSLVRSRIDRLTVSRCAPTGRPSLSLGCSRLNDTPLSVTSSGLKPARWKKARTLRACWSTDCWTEPRSSPSCENSTDQVARSAVTLRSETPRTVTVLCSAILERRNPSPSA
jgi:hypothetical protein